MASIAPIPFGTTPDGTSACLYRLANAHGMTADVADFGACLISLRVACGAGSFTDVVMGYDGVEDYTVNAPNFGATVGRHANRIGGARFSLGGNVYELPANENGNSLHSGPDFWHHRLWTVERAEQGADSTSITLSLASPDGDQGFPGAVDARVTYTLTADDALDIAYEANPHAATVVNLTNHSYFNLNGHASGTVLDHTLRIAAGAFTAVDGELVPTGELVPVEGTPLDFQTARTLRSGVESGYAPVAQAGGIDHNFALDGADYRLVAELAADKTPIAMEVLTDLPGVQVYTGNFIGREVGKGGAAYGNHEAVCLETQFFPDAVNHEGFEQPVFSPEHPYRSRTTYRFRCR